MKPEPITPVSADTLARFAKGFEQINFGAISAGAQLATAAQTIKASTEQATHSLAKLSGAIRAGVSQYPVLSGELVITGQDLLLTLKRSETARKAFGPGAAFSPTVPEWIYPKIDSAAGMAAEAIAQRVVNELTESKA